MIHVTNEKELRIAYEMLLFWSENAPHAKDSIKVADHIKQMKREIRRYNRLPADTRRVVRSDFDSAIVLVELPEAIKSREAAEEWFEENEVMHCRPSMYDCTGQLFTNWYRLFKRNGRFMAYHSVSMDV